MSFWIYALYAASLVLSLILRPIPEAPPKPNKSDLSVPNSREDNPVPVVFGSPELKACSIFWYGDVRFRAIKKKQSKK